MDLDVTLRSSALRARLEEIHEYMQDTVLVMELLLPLSLSTVPIYFF